MRKLFFIIGIFFLAAGCKKPCLLCKTDEVILKHDSIYYVQYDTIAHRYDSALIRIDTSVNVKRLEFKEVCPGSPEYNSPHLYSCY